jgi:hypothetical protein
MPSESKPPQRRFTIEMQRRFTIEIKVAGDTIEDALRLMDEFYGKIIEENIRNCVSGGATSGGYFVLTENPDMTHERYMQELDVYNAEKPS